MEWKNCCRVYRIHSISINRAPDPSPWTKNEQRDTDRREAKKLERKILTHKRLKKEKEKKNAIHQNKTQHAIFLDPFIKLQNGT